MTEPTELPVTVTADLDLSEIDAHTRRLTVDPRPVTADAPLLVERYRTDERVEVHNLEQHLAHPLRPRGSTTVHDHADFAALVNRLANLDHTVMYADVDKSTVTAVFNDAADPAAVVNQTDQAGWGDHRAVLDLRPDVDWTAWMSQDNQWSGQEDFAEHLEDLAHTITRPDAATLLEVALGFRATTTAAFSRATRTDNGNVQMSYSEQTNANAGINGSLEIPTEFTVRIAPWRGVDPVELVARFRYRLREGRLLLGYALLRPDRARDEAFALILRRLRDGVDADVPLIAGVAPGPVQARAATTVLR